VKARLHRRVVVALHQPDFPHKHVDIVLRDIVAARLRTGWPYRIEFTTNQGTCLFLFVADTQCKATKQAQNNFSNR